MALEIKREDFFRVVGVIVSLAFFFIFVPQSCIQNNPYESNIWGLAFATACSTLPMLCLYGRHTSKTLIRLLILFPIFFFSWKFLFWEYDPVRCAVEGASFKQDIFLKNKDLVMKSYDYMNNLCLFFVALYVPLISALGFSVYKFFSIEQNLKLNLSICLLSISFLWCVISIGSTYHLFAGLIYNLNSGSAVPYSCVGSFLMMQVVAFVFSVFFYALSEALISK